MKSETLKALKGSIEKWEKIVRNTRALDKRGSNCPLCEIFGYDKEGCDGCPVMENTGMEECDGTPYEKWHRHQCDQHLVNYGDRHRFNDCPDCLTLAKEELNFLKSLLPRGESCKN